MLASFGLTPLYFSTLLRYSAIVFFFNDTATTEIYTLSLHDALPIYAPVPSLVSKLPLVMKLADAGVAKQSPAKAAMTAMLAIVRFMTDPLLFELLVLIPAS